MKDYIKPTFILAGLFPVAFAVGSDCNAKISDTNVLTMLKQMGIDDLNQAFADTEDCEMGVPGDVLNYCKFTSVETGLLKILGS